MGHTSRSRHDAAEADRGTRSTSIAADTVVDAAECIVDAEGLSALSVRRLADELGVSRQVVYTHFDGMNGVLDALHRRFGVELTRRVRSLRSPTGSDDRMVEAGHAYVTAGRAHPGLFELTFGHPIATYRPSEETTEALRSVFAEHIVGLVREWAAADGITEVDPLAAARVLWASIHGLLTLERAGHASTADTDALTDRTVRSLLAGWRHAGVARLSLDG